MFDLHQGFSGNELGPDQHTGPTVMEAAMMQLEAAAAASRGRWRVAAMQQVEAWRLLGRAATHALKRRVGRR